MLLATPMRPPSLPSSTICPCKGSTDEQNYIIKALDLRRVLALYELGEGGTQGTGCQDDAFLYAREQYQEFVDSTFYRDSSLYPSPYYY